MPEIERAHLRHLGVQLYGLWYPACRKGQTWLGWPLVSDLEEVTCPDCKAAPAQPGTRGTVLT